MLLQRKHDPGSWAKIKRELITTNKEKQKDKDKEKEAINSNKENQSKDDRNFLSSSFEMRPTTLVPRSPGQGKKHLDHHIYDLGGNNNNNNGSHHLGSHGSSGIFNNMNNNFLMVGEKKKVMRLLVLGQDGVGKSAFVVRYLTRRFIGEYDPLIEDVFRKTVNLSNQDITIEMKDTSRGINWSKRSNDLIWTDALICMYSINNRSSFDDIQDLSKHIYQQKKSQGIPCLIVGNKKDLIHERKVDTSEGVKLAGVVNGTFCELSVRENYTDLDTVVSRFIKDNCSVLKHPASQQSKMLSSRSSPEIRNKSGGGNHGGEGGETEAKVERKGRALWQKLIMTNNDLKKKK